MSEPSQVTAIANFIEWVQRITLVADHFQLPPCVTAIRGNEWRDVAEAYVMQPTSLAGMELNVLRVQYRMHPGISAFPNQQFYEGKLENHPSTLRQAGVQCQCNQQRCTTSFVRSRTQRSPTGIDVRSEPYHSGKYTMSMHLRTIRLMVPCRVDACYFIADHQSIQLQRTVQCRVPDAK